MTVQGLPWRSAFVPSAPCRKGTSMCVPGASQLPCVVQLQAGPGKQTGETISPEPCWDTAPTRSVIIWICYWCRDKTSQHLYLLSRFTPNISQVQGLKEVQRYLVLIAELEQSYSTNPSHKPSHKSLGTESLDRHPGKRKAGQQIPGRFVLRNRHRFSKPQVTETFKQAAFHVSAAQHNSGWFSSFSIHQAKRDVFIDLLKTRNNHY